MNAVNVIFSSVWTQTYLLPKTGKYTSCSKKKIVLFCLQEFYTLIVTNIIFGTQRNRVTSKGGRIKAQDLPDQIRSDQSMKS